MGCGATKSSQVDSNIEERPSRHKPLTKEANYTTQNKYEDSITEDMKDHDRAMLKPTWKKMVNIFLGTCKSFLYNIVKQ